MAQGDVTVNRTQNDSHITPCFDGVDDFMSTSGDDFNFGTNGDLSVSFWFLTRKNLAAATSRILSKTDLSPAGGWFIDITNNKVRFFTLLGATYSATIDDAVIFLDNWVHIVVSVDRSVGTKIYINGSEVAVTETNPGNINDDIDSGLTLQFGKLDAQASNYIEGCLTDIQVFKKAVNATEASNLFNNIKVTDKLISRWNFEAGDYTDSFGSNDITNSGTVIGIHDDAIAAVVKDVRATANDQYLIYDALHGGVGTVHIEEV